MRDNIAIIIQARTGSKRLSRKVLRDFHEGKTILDIILTKLINRFGKDSVILATSVHSDDEDILKVGLNFGVQVFRGSESNVLSRFVEVAQKNEIENIIRVCADNPFLSMEFLDKLLSSPSIGEADYVAYKMSNGLPTILSHIGLFAECVSRKALERVMLSTSDSTYLEHVTNYIYTRPNEFNVVLHELPDFLSKEDNIRLTCDTLNDFELLQEIYNSIDKDNEDVIELIETINSNENWLNRMKGEITNNKKHR